MSAFTFKMKNLYHADISIEELDVKIEVPVEEALEIFKLYPQVIDAAIKLATTAQGE